MSKYRIRSYITPGVLTGLGIFVSNIYNINSSPEWDVKNGNFLRAYQFSVCITCKSFIYGTFYPFAWIGIASDTFSTKRLRRHFIPFSTYRI